MGWLARLNTTSITAVTAEQRIEHQVAKLFTNRKTKGRVVRGEWSSSALLARLGKTKFDVVRNQPHPNHLSDDLR